jgi:hypothetical protein
MASQAAPEGYELSDGVEPALARALVLAAEAQRWDVVVQIAGEPQARREARARDDCSSAGLRQPVPRDSGVGGARRLAPFAHYGHSGLGCMIFEMVRMAPGFAVFRC